MLSGLLSNQWNKCEKWPFKLRNTHGTRSRISFTHLKRLLQYTKSYKLGLNLYCSLRFSKMSQICRVEIDTMVLSDQVLVDV